jgi:2-polyprenyl-6-methoxyphenol hydroxylase-like FAD-dependent oxidoreductase
MTTATLEPNHTTCCIVGAGPAGAMLALLLARQGVAVTLLEAQHDLERTFRGDSIYPTILDVMDSIGLGESLQALPHAKAHSIRLITEHGPLEVGSFRRLRGRHPYLMIVPQSRFLGFVLNEARRHPNFKLEMGARVEALITDGSTVHGVRYRQDGINHELRATLTVGCDGRGSRVRSLSTLEAGLRKTAPATDLLWLSLPCDETTSRQDAVDLHVSHGHYLAILEHARHWQIGYGIPKGQFASVRAAGLEALQESIAQSAPWLRRPLEHITDWSQVRLLSVQTNRLTRWAQPGLLLIGDAAHTMSPIGGVGINLAIQDAVVAANHLIHPLRENRLTVQHLELVQREREWPVRLTQTWTRVLEWQLALAMHAKPAWWMVMALRSLMHVPALGDLSTWLTAYGVRSPRLLEPAVLH